MPLYEFEYFDEEGECFTFEDFLPATTDFTQVKSPCGKYNAVKQISSFAIGPEGRTRAEKTAGTTKKRVEFAKYAKDQREVRKKNSDPGTRAHDSNEIWMGNENLKGVINPKSYIKSKHTTVAPPEASQPRPAMTPEVVNI
jgi:hypothetical protein